MGVLDPVELHELAEHMRDGTWLDMRVIEHGTIERARVEAIIVRREDEEIELLQEHMLDGVVHQANVRVSADAIRWMKPSGFELVDVQVKEPPPPGKVDTDKVVSTVKDLLVLLYHDDKITPLTNRKAVEVMLAGSAYKSVFSHIRHIFVYLIWAYTDGELDPGQICKLAGYKSPMPLQSAKWKFNGKYAEDRKSLESLMASRGHVRVRAG